MISNCVELEAILLCVPRDDTNVPTDDTIVSRDDTNVSTDYTNVYTDDTNVSRDDTIVSTVEGRHKSARMRQIILGKHIQVNVAATCTCISHELSPAARRETLKYNGMEQYQCEYITDEDAAEDKLRADVEDTSLKLEPRPPAQTKTGLKYM